MFSRITCWSIKPLNELFSSGDLLAIRRISVEFCEDVAKNGTLYVEARFCPQLLMDEKFPEVTASHIIDQVLDGFKEGEASFGVKVLFCICLPSTNIRCQGTFSSMFHLSIHSLAIIS